MRRSSTSALLRTTVLCSPIDRAFSLVELVLVIVIIGIIAAIAVPRISSAGEDAKQVAVESTITTVSKAIDLFYADHGRYPGYDPSNSSPSGEWFVNQLTMFTDKDGNTSSELGHPYIYGPYIRAPFPANPLNGLSTVSVKKVSTTGTVLANSTGWIASLDEGHFGINTTAAVAEKLALEWATFEGVMNATAKSVLKKK